MKHWHSLSIILTLFTLAACVADDNKSGSVGDEQQNVDGTRDDSRGGQADDLRDDETNLEDPVAVPEFGTIDTRTFVTVGTAADGLNTPRDLAFNPLVADQLWTWNRGSDGTVIYHGAGSEDQVVDARNDAFGYHFMEEVSAAAFGVLNNFATCGESRNTYNGQAAGDDFMGPALWPSDLEVYSRVNQNRFSQLGGSHLDMLHGSPYCMGIAHAQDNAFYVFDGLNGHIVYYDFVEDHGPGHDDHSDGIIRRYPEATVTRVPDVVSHMEMDTETQILYVADTGGARIMALSTLQGMVTGTLPLVNEILAEYSTVEGAAWNVVVGEGLTQPSGLAIHDGRLFVSDHATGEIIAFELNGTEIERITTGAQSIMGLAVGPEGRIWFVDAAANQLVRVDP